MKLPFDQNLSFRLCRQLDDIFPGSNQVHLVGLTDADDRSIWQYASENGYILVTLDADFAELASLRGPPPKVIWLRCGNQPTESIADLLRQHADAIAAFEGGEAACLEIY
jgi:predicted nuclease of predicted toxin-antitoxin system